MERTVLVTGGDRGLGVGPHALDRSKEAGMFLPVSTRLSGAPPTRDLRRGAARNDRTKTGPQSGSV